MRWSKLKQLIEARFAAEIQGRVQIHTTRYHSAHDQEGEIYVTLDGTKIYGTSYYEYWKARRSLYRAEGENPEWSDVSRLEDQLRSEGTADQIHLLRNLFASLSEPIEDMLTDPRPLIRALGILDARCGKRRLARLDGKDEHTFVQIAISLRRMRNSATACVTDRAAIDQASQES